MKFNKQFGGIKQSVDGFCCPHFFDEMFGRLKNILYLCTRYE